MTPLFISQGRDTYFDLFLLEFVGAKSVENNRQPSRHQRIEKAIFQSYDQLKFKVC
jgi:hypothetical protein